MSSATSVNRIIANHSNALREAVITASAQRASTEIRLLSQSRQGRGRMVLSGPYSGAADTLVDVEVVSGAGSAMRATAPQIQGVGNGTLTVTSLDAGAVAETLTFTMADDGDPATYAELPFYGVTLRAKTAGAAGNALAIAVTRNLVYTNLPYSLLDQLDAGKTELGGAQWDFGAVAATAEGIPAGAPRIAFETFPQIHRHWKEWTEGRWIYRIDPAPTWNVPEDVQVQGVSGDYTLVLSDGVTTETYTATTTHDFLVAVQSRSALIDVIGVVVADTAPGGQAVTDIPLRTDAHALPVEAKVSGKYAKTYLDDVSVAPAAPTENVRVLCLGVGSGAKERWSVNGSVSGALGTATTGLAFASSVCGFTIPDSDVPSGASRISAKFTPTSREDDEGVPSVCFKPLKRGAAATAKTLTFTYTKRPPAVCDCANLPDLYLSDACLGLRPAGDDMDYPPDVATRIAAAYQWREDYTRANTAYSAGTDDQYVPGAGTPGTPDTFLVVGFFYETMPSGFSAKVSFQLREEFVSLDAANAHAETFDGSMASTVVGNLNLYGSLTINGEAAFVTATAFSAGATINKTTTVTASGYTKPGEPGTDPGPDEVIPGEAATFTAASTDLKWMDSALAIVLPCLVEIQESPTAIAAWDTLWDEVVADLAHLEATVADDITSPNADYLRRYSATCDNLRIEAGIYPKFDAGSQGDGCWRDLGGAFWWVESTGRYLPAFTNEAYISSSTGCGELAPEGSAYSTQEFGFGLVVDCAGSLKEGDAFTLTIDGSSALGYSEGDLFVLPVIGAQAAAFGGGEDGDATQTWAVAGSVGGAYPDWLWDPGAPSAYSAGPANATLAAGGIPFEQGDQISLAIEGGQLRWRRDGGAWTTGDLYATAHPIGNGLSLSAVPAAAPSFLAGDTWTFKASATHGLAHLRQPREGQAFAWDGATVTLDVDLGAARPLECLLMALHTIPVTASILVAGSVDTAPHVDDWLVDLQWRAGAMLATLAPGATARYLTISISGAGAGASIGWLWAGVPWAATAEASAMQHTRQYGLSRTSGRNPSALYRGRGTGGRWGWSLGAQSALLQNDVTGLLALLDHVAEQGLEWVCLVPDVRHPAGATLAQIDADEAALTENLGYTLDGSALFDAELPFRAVLA